MKNFIDILMDSSRRCIPGICDEYTVDDQGNVYRDEEIMTPSKNAQGYLRVSVRVIASGKCETFFVHRLVAMAWCSGYDPDRGRTCVDHKNGDKTDNRAENLRWVTQEENAWYAMFEQNLYDPAFAPKTVMAVRADDVREFIEFPSIKSASRELGVNCWHIHAICYKSDGGRKTAGGWYFEFA